MKPLSRRSALLGGFAGAALAPLAARGQSPEDAAARYLALALQTRCDAITQDASLEGARARMAASITRIGAQIMASRAFLQTFTGAPLKLVVLPEYVLSGFRTRESHSAWRAKAALEPDGPEYEALAAVAERAGAYLCVNAYETDANFPDLYFQANVVFSPSGEIVLRYRRMISLYTPTPYQVWDRYLEIYGYDAVFPVARTEIGVLGTVASEEVLYPEIARMTAMKGAELLLHPTSEAGAPGLSMKAVARRARALENMAYVVSANTAEILGSAAPAASTDAMSTIIDWSGRFAAEAESGESLVAHGIVDLPALRAARGRTGMSNLLSRQPYAAYAPAYADTQGAPPNLGADGRPADRAELLARQRAVIERLAEQQP